MHPVDVPVNFECSQCHTLDSCCQQANISTVSPLLIATVVTISYVVVTVSVSEDTLASIVSEDEDIWYVVLPAVAMAVPARKAADKIA